MSDRIPYFNYFMNNNEDEDGSHDNKQTARMLSLFYVLKVMKEKGIVNFTEQDLREYKKLEEIFVKQSDGMNFDDYVMSGVWKYFQEILEDTRRRLKAIDTVEQHREEINHIFLELLKINNIPLNLPYSSEYMQQFVEYILDKVVPEFERNVAEYDINNDNKALLCNSVASKFFPGSCSTFDGITKALKVETSSPPTPAYDQKHTSISYAFLTPTQKKQARQATKLLKENERKYGELLKAIKELKDDIKSKNDEITKTLTTNKSTLDEKLDEQKTALSKEIVDKIANVEGKLTGIETVHAGILTKMTEGISNVLDNNTKLTTANQKIQTKYISELAKTVKKIEEIRTDFDNKLNIANNQTLLKETQKTINGALAVIETKLENIRINNPIPSTSTVSLLGDDSEIDNSVASAQTPTQVTTQTPTQVTTQPSAQAQAQPLQNKINMFHSIVKLLFMLNQFVKKKEVDAEGTAISQASQASQASQSSQAGGKRKKNIQNGIRGGSVFDDNNYKQIKQLHYDIVERHYNSLEILYKEYTNLIEEYNKIKDKKYNDDPLTRVNNQLNALSDKLPDENNNSSTASTPEKKQKDDLEKQKEFLEKNNDALAKEAFNYADMLKDMQRMSRYKEGLSSVDSKVSTVKANLMLSISQLKFLIDELYKSLQSSKNILPYNEDIKSDIRQLYKDLEHFTSDNNDHKMIIDIIKLRTDIEKNIKEIETSIKQLEVWSKALNEQIEFLRKKDTRGIAKDELKNTGINLLSSFLKGGAVNENIPNFADKFKFLSTLKENLHSLYTNLKEFNDTSVRSNRSILKVPSMYENIWNEYVKLNKYYKQNNKLPIYAEDMLHDKIKLYDLDPAKVLKVTFEDKVVFIALIFIVRLIIVILLELFIDYNIIRTLHYAMVFYAILYIFVILALILIINYDSYKLRILVNYLNLHINSTKIFMHILLFVLFIGLVYMMIKSQDTLDNFGTLFDFTNIYKHIYELTETTQEQSDVRLSQSQKLKLQYRIDIITMIVFIFTAFLILVV